jgi:hypothetical protein
MRCRRVICADCRTRVDEINYCHACLRALGARQEPLGVGSSFDRFLQASVLLGVGLLVLFGLAWLSQGALTRWGS